MPNECPLHSSSDHMIMFTTSEHSQGHCCTTYRTSSVKIWERGKERETLHCPILSDATTLLMLCGLTKYLGQITSGGWWSWITLPHDNTNNTSQFYLPLNNAYCDLAGGLSPRKMFHTVDGLIHKKSLLKKNLFHMRFHAPISAEQET